MDRRSFLTTSGLAAIATALPTAVFAQTGGDAALNALFERIFVEAVARSPELATSLGLDRGPGAALKSQLSPRTATRRTQDLALVQQALAQLSAVDRASISDANRLNLDVVKYQLEGQMVAPAEFGIDSVVRPYRIFQQGGAYSPSPTS